MHAYTVMNNFSANKTHVLSALIFSAALTGCSSMSNMSQNVSSWAGTVARPESQIPTSCKGWQKIDVKGQTRYLLLKKDASLLMNIDAHNLRGRELGCWS